jgi:hypothetical protein
MALLIFPLAIVLGWFVRPPRRAATATYALGFGVFVVLSLLWVVGLEVSPWEAVVLIVGTPLAGSLASWVGRWRLSRRPPAGVGPDNAGPGSAAGTSWSV